MPRPGPSTVNVDWDVDDRPVRYRARDDRIDTTHSENGTVLASVPLPTRQQTSLNLARLIAGEGWSVVPSESATSAAAMQEDLARILDALGLDVISRPYSPHEAVTRDVLPAIERLREDATRHSARCGSAVAPQPDRPEPVDPASVRVGDIVDYETTVEYRLCRIMGEVEQTAEHVTGEDGTSLKIHGHWWNCNIATVRILQRPEPDPEQVRAWTQWLVDHGAGSNGVAETLTRAGLEVPNG